MSSPTAFEIKLIEKITRAKVHLGGVNALHGPSCPIQDETSLVPCNCGASAINSKIQSALDELSLDE